MHEHLGHYVQQCKVPSKNLLQCNFHTVESTGLGHAPLKNIQRMRNYGFRWTWSSASLGHQTVQTIIVHTLQTHLCIHFHILSAIPWKALCWAEDTRFSSNILLHSFRISNFEAIVLTYTVFELSQPPRESSSACGMSQWYRVTYGLIPDK